LEPDFDAGNVFTDFEDELDLKCVDDFDEFFDDFFELGGWF
jgi:hypothetical protein